MTNGANTGVPSTSMTGPKGLDNRSRKVRASTASIPATRGIIACPVVTRFAQRWIDATTSCARTGEPSWNIRPGRSVKVQVRPSGEVTTLSAICNCGFSSASIVTSTS